MENQKVKDKYQERVKALAEKMADCEYKLIPHSTDNWENDRVIWTEGYIPAARIAVGEMAEAVGMSLSSGIVDYLARLPVNRRLEIITGFVIQQGLIPDSAQDLPKQLEYIPPATLTDGRIDENPQSEGGQNE